MRTVPRAAPKIALLLSLLSCCLPIIGCFDDDSTAAGADGASCHASYDGACLDPAAADYDCEGGTGDGPRYTGYVSVVGPDEYGLDRDGDGEACES